MDNTTLYQYLSQTQVPRTGRPGSQFDRIEISTEIPRFRDFISATDAVRTSLINELNRPGPFEGAGDNRSVTRRDSGWLERAIRELETASPGKQVAIGGVSGWASGYVFGKIGKAALLAMGGSIVLLQFANYQGLIQINWTNVERSFENTRQRFSQQMFDSVPVFLNNTKEFARRHVFLAGSFFAGFILGLAT